MDWAQVLTIIISLGTLVIYITERSDKRGQRLEDRSDEKFQKQTDRSDRLYQMFIDLLKEKKNG